MDGKGDEVKHGARWLVLHDGPKDEFDGMIRNLPDTYKVNGQAMNTFKVCYCIDNVQILLLQIDRQRKSLEKIFKNCSIKHLRPLEYDAVLAKCMNYGNENVEGFENSLSPKKGRFSQEKLNNFALALGIRNTSTLIYLYCNIHLVLKPDNLSKWNPPLIVDESEVLYREHIKNSGHFKNIASQSNAAKNAVVYCEACSVHADLLTRSNIDVLVEYLSKYRSDYSEEADNIAMLIEVLVCSSRHVLKKEERHERMFILLDNVLDIYFRKRRNQYMLLYGQLRAGKTTLADILLSPLNYVTIDPNPIPHSDFWLEAAVHARAVLFDDVNTNGITNLLTVTNCLDGHVSVPINSKHQKHVQMKFPPGIITTNNGLKEYGPLPSKLLTRTNDKLFMGGMDEYTQELCEKCQNYSREDKIEGLCKAIHEYYLSDPHHRLTGIYIPAARQLNFPPPPEPTIPTTVQEAADADSQEKKAPEAPANLPVDETKMNDQIDDLLSNPPKLQSSITELLRHMETWEEPIPPQLANQQDSDPEPVYVPPTKIMRSNEVNAFLDTEAIEYEGDVEDE